MGTTGRLPVFPLVTGGLHCGWINFANVTIEEGLFPPVGGGLHCGNANAYDGLITTLIVFPPVGGGLHCSPWVPTRYRAPSPCSRRPTAGSIAAWPSPRLGK